MRSVVWRGTLALVTLLATGAPPAAAQSHGDARPGAAPAPSASAGDREYTDPSAPAAGPGESTAAPPPDSLVARALRRAPTLAALRARVRAAREMVRPAGALPNPMVEVMLQDVDFPRWTVGEMEMSMIGPQVSQGIPFPGKRGARRRAAQAEVTVKENEFELLRREVTRDIRRLYARIYAVDSERSALSSGRELLEVLTATVRERYSAGVAEAEAAIKSQLVLSRVNERLDDLDAERAELVAAVNRFLDQPGDAPLDRVAALPEPAVPPAPWADAALEHSAEVAVRRADVEAAGLRLRAARLERWPDFVAGAGIGFRGGLDPAVTLRLGLDLPLWSAQNQGPMIRAAEHELEASRHASRDAEALARSEAARLEARWTAAGAQVSRYRQGIVPQSGLALDAARSSYLVGRGDFSTVIEDFDIWLGARSGLARREAERFTAWAELQTIVGSGGPDDDAGRGR